MTDKAQAAAEEYQRDDNRPKIGPKNSFLAGVEWLKEELLQSPDGFDDNDVIVDSNDNEWVAMNVVKLKIQALREETRSLLETVVLMKAENARLKSDFNRLKTIHDEMHYVRGLKA